jgi:dethiobiotin synthetase
MKPIFISGIGTGIGKTLISAIFTEALKADYWKPVQAGIDPETDSTRLHELISHPGSVIHPETYRLQLAASPHIASRKENRQISLNQILDQFNRMDHSRPLVIEGAGGLMVPLNESEFVIDLVRQLGARLVLVSRNYLGSINHSLMTARICCDQGLDVRGWVFNDQYMDYAQEIASWSDYPVLFSLPAYHSISKQTITDAARHFEHACRRVLSPGSSRQAE